MRLAGRSARYLAGACLVFLFSATALGQHDVDAHVSRIEVLVADSASPGLVVAVVQGDDMLLERGFGVRDVESGRAVSADMAFRNGSTTKMMVAAALLEALAECGLDPQQAIGGYVPDLDPAIGRLSVHQLLTHTSGLADKADDFGLHDESALAKNVLAKSADDFFAVPGEVYSYSNPGYDIAGFVLAILDRAPFADAFRARILGPAGMQRSMFRATMAMTYPFALPHRQTDSGDVEVIRPMPDNSAEWPSGLMYTTAGDLAAFGRLLLDQGRAADGDAVINSATVDALTAPRVAVPGADHGASYGYGIGLLTVGDTPLWRHTGGIAGFSTVLTIVPNRKLVIAIMMNGPDDDLIDGVESLLLEALADVRMALPEPEPLPLSSTVVSALAGQYGQVEPELELRADAIGLRVITPDGESLGQLLRVDDSMPVSRFAIVDDGEIAGRASVTWSADGKPRFLHDGSRAMTRLSPDTGP